MRHLLEIDDLSVDELKRILELAVDPAPPQVLAGQGMALLFEKPSARTRNSMEMAVVQLGGHPMYIQGDEVGMDVRESVEDVTRTLACFHACIGARVFGHSTVERMAAVDQVPAADVRILHHLKSPVERLPLRRNGRADPVFPRRHAAGRPHHEPHRLGLVLSRKLEARAGRCRLPPGWQRQRDGTGRRLATAVPHRHTYFARVGRAERDDRDMRGDLDGKPRHHLQLHPLLTREDVAAVPVHDRPLDGDPDRGEVELEGGPKRRRPERQPEGHIRIELIPRRIG